MKKHSAAAAALFACLLPFTAQAEKFALRLTGFQETPLTLSSPASGEFEARISQNDDSITWELSYRDFPTSVLQAHIHFGQRATTGGISIFLCSNLGNGPAGTLACPQMGTIGGVITAANVIGPAAQGIAAGELAEIIAAIRAGYAYVNVHTTQFPGGEIRAQFHRKHPDRGRGNDHHD
jgi:CHRD domain-containing protein